MVAHIADFEPVDPAPHETDSRSGRTHPLQRRSRSVHRPSGYHERELEEELALIEASRRHMTCILRTLPASAFQRRGIHSENGPITLKSARQHRQPHSPSPTVYRGKTGCLGEIGCGGSLRVGRARSAPAAFGSHLLVKPITLMLFQQFPLLAVKSFWRLALCEQ